MRSSNIATSKEQSKRILECGIDPKSADLSLDPETDYLYLMRWSERCHSKVEIPAWSLSSLLEMIPQRIMMPHCLTPCDFILHHHPCMWSAMYHDGKTSGDSEDYMLQCGSVQTADDPIEVCVKMIEWLQKNLQFKL